jgi:nitrogen fixation protein FixH
MTAPAMKEITGRHVLLALVGFFGVMLLANGIFLYFALSTFDGLSTPHPYQEGLHYNERIAEERRQAALGWSYRLAVTGERRLELTIRDKTGNPVSGLEVRGDIARAVADRVTGPRLLKEGSAGTYVVSVEDLEPGNWIVSLEAASAPSQGPATHYRIKQRLWLKPNS